MGADLAAAAVPVAVGNGARPATIRSAVFSRVSPTPDTPETGTMGRSVEAFKAARAANGLGVASTLLAMTRAGRSERKAR